VVNEARSAPYRAADYLTTPEDIQEYLNAALEDGDERVMRQALRNVAEVVRATLEPACRTEPAGSDLDSLLSAADAPGLAKLNATLKAIGLTLAVRPNRHAA
jgi:DNA-binding phage protein